MLRTTFSLTKSNSITSSCNSQDDSYGKLSETYTTDLSMSTAPSNRSSLESLNADDSSKHRKKRPNIVSLTMAKAVTYGGWDIFRAAEQGNLPVCVLLWGMASAKRISLMLPDEDGCNPVHYASMAETSEVSPL